MKLKPYFRAAVKANALELFIYDEIGADWFGEGITAATVQQQIANAGAFDSIKLRINSPGGDAFEGIAIHSLLRSQGKPIDVYVDGVAASAASVIAMAGDTITMASAAMLMIHDAWTLCMGNDEDMRKMADTLQKLSASIAQVYVDRTGKPLDEVSALMDAETWMSAQEALDGGFCTAITKQDNKKAMAMARNFKSLAALQNVPDSLKAESADPVCECACEACMDSDCKNCTHEACDCKNCVDCPMVQSDEDGDMDAQVETPSNLSLYEARLSMLRTQ